LNLRHFCGILNIYYDDTSAAVTMEFATGKELTQQFGGVGDGQALRDILLWEKNELDGV
jgi:hypothetical protein